MATGSWVRTGGLDDAGRRVLAGIAITLALGVAVASLVHGPRSFAEHARVLERHATTPSGNLAGLPAVLSYSPGQTTARELADFRLSDPTEPWVQAVHARRRERAPIWIAAVLASLLFVGWTAYRGAESWEGVVMGGAVLYCLQDMTSYDYVWMLLLVPFVAASRRAGLALVGYALATVGLALLVADVEINHLLYGPLLLLSLLVVYVDAFRRFDRRAGTAPAPSGAPG